MIKLAKVLCFIVCVAIIGAGSISIYNYWTASQTKTSSECRQPGAYFPQDEERFVLVDKAKQNIGGETYECKVIADKYMLTMYLIMETGVGNYKSSTMTQIFYEDGSPMIYDDVELAKEIQEVDVGDE